MKVEEKAPVRLRVLEVAKVRIGGGEGLGHGENSEGDGVEDPPGGKELAHEDVGEGGEADRVAEEGRHDGGQGQPGQGGRHGLTHLVANSKEGQAKNSEEEDEKLEDIRRRSRRTGGGEVGGQEEEK